MHMSHFATLVQLFMQHNRTPPYPRLVFFFFFLDKKNFFFFSVQYNKMKVVDLAEVARDK